MSSNSFYGAIPSGIGALSLLVELYIISLETTLILPALHQIMQLAHAFLPKLGV